jgi:hypothetical protein
MAQRDALVTAAAADDVATLRRLLDEDARQLNSQDLQGTTPMVAAAKANSVGALHVLIEYGTKRGPFYWGQGEALQVAMVEGQFEAMQVLRAAGAAAALPDRWPYYKYDRRFFLAMCTRGKAAGVETMLKICLEPRVVARGMYVALAEGHVQVVQVLLRHMEGDWFRYNTRFLYSEPNGFGKALRNGHVEVVQELLLPGHWDCRLWRGGVRTALKDSPYKCSVPDAITMIEVSPVYVLCFWANILVSCLPISIRSSIFTHSSMSCWQLALSHDLYLLHKARVIHDASGIQAHLPSCLVRRMQASEPLPTVSVAVDAQSPSDGAGGKRRGGEEPSEARMEILVATVNFVVKDLKADLYVELTHMLMPTHEKDEEYDSGCELSEPEEDDSYLSDYDSEGYIARMWDGELGWSM